MASNPSVTVSQSIYFLDLNRALQASSLQISAEEVITSLPPTRLMTSLSQLRSSFCKQSMQQCMVTATIDKQSMQQRMVLQLDKQSMKQCMVLQLTNNQWNNAWLLQLDKQSMKQRMVTATRQTINGTMHGYAP